LQHARHRRRLLRHPRLPVRDARAHYPPGPLLAPPATRRRPRPARGRDGQDLRRHRRHRADPVQRLVPAARGPRTLARPALMRLRSSYRQFEELTPDEISRSLRERRDEERRLEVVEQATLDLSGAAWHGPPHPEIVNAATFALRRAVNTYPDDSPL